MIATPTQCRLYLADSLFATLELRPGARSTPTRT